MKAFEDKLQSLREEAASLETASDLRTRQWHQVRDHVERFFASQAERSVYTAPGRREEALEALAIGEHSSSLDGALRVLRRHVDGFGQNLGSSRFFAYIPSGGLYASALADYMAAVSNPYSGVGAAAPGASRMEQVLLRWLARVMGYPAEAEGDLTSGGSMAALSAIVTAREAHAIKSANVARSVVYLTAHTHHTFRKAMHVAGVGECIVREVPVDAARRMDPAALRTRIEEDRNARRRPWLVAATAGTTDAGAIDPLPAIADIAQEFGLWFHVDAAYGGAFALCADGRKRLRGIERSDSLIFDPHKGFFLPCGTGVVLVRDGQKLYDAYHARGIYMQDVAEDPERSPCDFSAELTRPFRALRFWLPFKVYGSRAFAAALEEKLILARYFHEQAAKIPGIELGPEPDLSIVTFRFRPGDGDSDRASRALVKAINEDGRIFITSTRIDGRFTIRMAILTYSSHLEDVDLALQVIREHAAALSRA